MPNTDETESLDMVVVPEESMSETLLDEIEDNDHHYLEPSHPLRYWLRIVPLILLSSMLIGSMIVSAKLFTASVMSEFWFLMLTIVALMVLGICYFLFARERWMYRNWKLELNPQQNAITLYRHGNRKLLIPERNARTIPISGSAVTKNEQNAAEQFVFTHSSTVSIDNDIQGDEMFSDMRFVRDGHRLRQAIIWYNNLHRREERAELEILVEIRDLLVVVVNHICPDGNK